VTKDRQLGNPGLVKVTFILAPGEWHGSATETLWAQPVGSGLYRLDNSPFFAFGISHRDVVVAGEEGGKLVFLRAASRGGHSTYRILLKGSERGAFGRYWKPLQDAGCSYEEGPAPLLAVDVPPGADIYEVYRLLQAGEDAGVWSFEEGHCGHAVG